MNNNNEFAYIIKNDYDSKFKLIKLKKVKKTKCFIYFNDGYKTYKIKKDRKYPVFTEKDAYINYFYKKLRSVEFLKNRLEQEKIRLTNVIDYINYHFDDVHIISIEVDYMDIEYYITRNKEKVDYLKKNEIRGFIEQLKDDTVEYFSVHYDYSKKKIPYEVYFKIFISSL